MDACSDPGVETVVVMSSAQVGKTTFIKAVIGFHVDQDPAPILLLNPTLEMSETFSKDRLAPMVRDTPCLRGKIADPRSRDSGNTLLSKRFAGGHITMAGANSPASLASRPIRIVLCDEVDRYPPSAGTEGDPVNLSFKRSVTFWNRKRVLTSTPTIKGASRIETAYEQSDKRRYHVPCPYCRGFQTLRWAQVKWPEDKPAEAHYKCEHCGSAITDADKIKFLREGEWRAGAEFNGTAGFHLNELYSPWRKFGEVAEDFLAAKKGGRETLKTWVNTSLGETWEEDQGERPDWAQLQARAEPYKVLSVPQGGLFLTAGVDVQNDRLAVKVKAWGRDEESWLIYWGELYGDPSQPGGVWNELDAMLVRNYEHASGALLPITAASVDSGHHTHPVYNYCRKREPLVAALKGMGQVGRPVLSRPSVQDVQYQGAVIKDGVKLWPAGVDTAKRQIYHRLKLTKPGPGYMHFPQGLDDEYYQQLTAEKLVTRYTQGVPHTEFVRAHERNEGIDCEVYAYHAAIRAGMGRIDWDKLEQALVHKIAEQKAGAPAKTSQRRIRSRGI